MAWHGAIQRILTFWRRGAQDAARMGRMSDASGGDIFEQMKQIL